MNKDIRIAVTLPDHPKTVKLMRHLGDRSFFNLIKLWTWIALNKPDGRLYSLSIEDLEIASDWQGEPNAFITELIDLKFLDTTEGGLQVHDWEEHNEYASKAGDRSTTARTAARVRWDKKNTMRSAQKSNANQPKEQCPLPTPTPTPTPTRTDICQNPPDSDPSTSIPEKVQNVVTSWNFMAKQFKLPTVRDVTPSRKKKVSERLKNRFWKENYDEAISRIPSIAWMTGNNDRSWKAHFDWFLRPDTLAKIMEEELTT